ncbi:unnamed protein product [Thlaspi arvense]|uniref:Uncharacterized protein n=1 Tax=Thlaspi arvense TaxID=13288 RepID=A0AAU9RP43_THLAR|nr:unnamed protein product [Thlaspi arvense]
MSQHRAAVFSITLPPFTVAGDLLLQVTAIVRESFRCYLSSKLRPLCLFPVVGVATSLSVPQAFSSPLLFMIGVWCLAFNWPK